MEMHRVRHPNFPPAYHPHPNQHRFQFQNSRSPTGLSKWTPPNPINRFPRPRNPQDHQYVSSQHHSRPRRPVPYDFYSRLPHQPPFQTNPRSEGHWQNQFSPPPRGRLQFPYRYGPPGPRHDQAGKHGQNYEQMPGISGIRRVQLDEEYNSSYASGFRAGQEFPGRRGLKISEHVGDSPSRYRNMVPSCDNKENRDEHQTHLQVHQAVVGSKSTMRTNDEMDKLKNRDKDYEAAGHLMRKNWYGDVAVGPIVQLQNIACCSSEQISIDDDDEDHAVDSVEEEYEPEHPEINQGNRLSTYNVDSEISDSSDFGEVEGTVAEGQVQESKRMASCDEQGFHEAFVGICISQSPESVGRMLDVAGFGVWFSDRSSSNFSGVLDSNRPQNRKAVMIYGSSKTIEAMKRAGYTRIRVNLESDYLNKNVLSWISKYMDNPKAEPSNWDEYKYQSEIINLCESASGMVIKWSHCVDGSAKKSGLQKAKCLAKKAADAWTREVQSLGGDSV